MVTVATTFWSKSVRLLGNQNKGLGSKLLLLQWDHHLYHQHSMISKKKKNPTQSLRKVSILLSRSQTSLPFLNTHPNSRTPASPLSSDCCVSQFKLSMIDSHTLAPTHQPTRIHSCHVSDVRTHIQQRRTQKSKEATGLKRGKMRRGSGSEVLSCKNHHAHGLKVGSQNRK